MSRFFSSLIATASPLIDSIPGLGSHEEGKPKSLLFCATFCLSNPHDCVLSFLNSGKKKEPPIEEHQRAQDTILKAIASVEDSVHKAVESEVNTLFHELPHHEQEKARIKAKKVVEKGAQKAGQKGRKGCQEAAAATARRRQRRCC